MILMRLALIAGRFESFNSFINRFAHELIIGKRVIFDLKALALVTFTAQLILIGIPGSHTLLPLVRTRPLRKLRPVCVRFAIENISRFL